MKKFRSMIALLVIALMAAALAACGGGTNGIKKGEEFTVGEYNMVYEGARVDSDGTTVGFLLKERTGLPVTVENGNMTLLINMKLINGSDELKAARLSAQALENDPSGIEGARVEFTFETTDSWPIARVFLTKDETQYADLDVQSGLGGSGSSGGSQTGMIIAIVLALLAIGGGVFAWKKGFFRKDPGPAAGNVFGDASVTPAAPGAPAAGIAPAAPGAPVAGAAPVTPGAVPQPAPAAGTVPAAPAAAPAVETASAPTPAAEPAPTPAAGPTIRLDVDDAPIPAAAPAEPAPVVVEETIVVEEAPAAAEETIVFLENANGDDGVSTYEIYKGPDKASAIEFLRTKPAPEAGHYIVVDTPEGSFGRDSEGFYQE